MIAGRDIFSSTPHYAALYNRNFVTPLVMYNNAEDTSTWTANGNETDQFKENYLNYYMSQVRNRYSMSLAIEDTDFYRFVWGNTRFRSYGKEDDYHVIPPQPWEAPEDTDGPRPE